MKLTPSLKRALRLGLHWLTIFSWVAGLVLTVSPVPAAYALTLNVNTTADIVDVDGCSGTCSLREALIIANGAAGADTINIPAGTYNLTRTGGGGPADLGDLDIIDTITFSGAGAATTIINASTLVTLTDRVFEVIGARATFNGLTIVGGAPTAPGGGILVDATSAVTLTNSIVATNASTQGGGLHNDGGTLVLDNTIVRNNGSTGSGGGIFNDTGSTLTLLNNSQVLTNTATNDGGGIFNEAASTFNATLSTISGNSTTTGSGAGVQSLGTASFTNSTISNNTATNNGGGFNNAGGTVTISGGVIQGNTASGSNGGGGFRNSTGGTATLTGVTISGNDTTANNSAGAGVLNSSGQITLSGSTVTANTAVGTGTDGGGVALVAGASVTLTTSTVSNNSAVDNGGGLYNNGGTLILSTSSVLTNTAGVGGGIVNDSGSLNVTGGSISGNSASASTGGGGIRNNNGGTVTITSATISNNSASAGRGGGILNSIGAVNLTGVTVGPGNTAGTFGGGVSNSNVTTTLTINNSTITGNTATGGTSGGAGLDNDGGALTLINSTVSNNALSGTAGGGGLRNETGNVSITTSTFSNNSTSNADGGGIFNTAGGILNIITSTLNNNTAGLGGGSGDGGGIANDASTVAITASVLYSNTADGGNGGGIESNNVGATLRLDNVTLSTNRVTGGSGGGLRNNTSSGALLANVTIKDNTMAGGNGDGLRNVGTLIIRNSALVNNGTTQNCSNAGTMTSQGFNLKSDTSCNAVFVASGDLTNTIPLFGSLANNGGSTLTHALLNGSPAIDAGNNVAGCLNTAGAVFTTDQRGRARPVNGRCDIGAFEFESADLSISKTNDQTAVVPGSSIQYTIIVTNTSVSVTVPNAVVTDIFPAQLTNVTWSCTPNDGGANCDAAGSSGNISTTVDLAPGSSATFIANADVLSNLPGGILTNTAYITPSAGLADPSGANNSATDADPLTPEVDLVVDKTDGQTTDIPGTNIVYTITVDNSGVSDAINAIVTDTLPAGLTSVTWSCSASVGSNCDSASGSTTLSTTVDIAVGGTVTFVLTGSIPSGATGTLTNTVTATAPAGATDLSTSDNTATDVTTLVPNVDLGLSKTDDQITTTAGSLITYTIVVSNTGPSDATSATVTDTFPATITGVTWTCSASGGSSCPASGNGDINTTVTLLPGGTATFIASGSVAVTATGIIANTAYAAPAGGTTDTDTSNNEATDATAVDVQIDLQVTKGDGQTEDIPGTTITYTIVVENIGDDDATDATVTDILSSNFTGITWTCVAGPTSNCDTPSGSGDINTTVDVASGDAVTFTVNATIDPGATGTLTNTATASALGDIDPANDTGTDTTTMTPQADLGILKTDGLSNIVPGSVLTYTITVNNVGPSTATGLTVTDTFPTVIEGVTWICTATGAGAACPASGSGDINTSAVDLPPGTTVTFQATGTLTTTAALGTLSNTAYVSAPAGVTDPDLSDNSEADLTNIVGMIINLFLPLIRR